ncbi:MAG: hypothetical protein WAT46_07630, partial [Saprospiraceae bacterium]
MAYTNGNFIIRMKGSSEACLIKSEIKIGSNIIRSIPLNNLCFKNIIGEYQVELSGLEPTNDKCLSILSNTLEIESLFKPDCETEFFTIQKSVNEDGFLIYSNIVDSIDSNNLMSFSLNNRNDTLEFSPHRINKINLDSILDIKNDQIGNKYFITNHRIPKLVKFTRSDSLLWQTQLPKFKIFEISEIRNDEFSIIGFDSLSNKWVIKGYNAQGSLLNERNIDLPSSKILDIHHFSNTVVAIDTTVQKIIFHSNNRIVEKNIPNGIVIKDVKSLSNDHILLAGEFTGSITIGNKTNNANEYTNPIFLTYDKNGTLLASKSVEFERDETIVSIATRDSSEVAYYGKKTEYFNLDTNITSFQVDKCNTINIINISDSCVYRVPKLLYDSTLCTVNWFSPFDVQSVLEYKINGEWQKLLSASSPYQIPGGKDGQYRLSATKPNCPIVYSDEVVTSCACVCLVPSLSQAGCKLEWSSPTCVGYTTHLQRKINDTWTSILGATSPYTIPSGQHGEYRLSVTK